MRVEVFLFIAVSLNLATAGPGPKPKGVRLRGGATKGQGRAEVNLNGRWGAVCSDHWTIKEATVVCRELGYKNAFAALTKSYHGEARGPIWIKNVRCHGDENKLSECRQVRISKKISQKSYENVDEIRECSYNDQAGVICVEPPNPDKKKIFITEPLKGTEHRLVLVEDGGKMYPACKQTFSSKEAIVACRQYEGEYAELVGKIWRKSPKIRDTYDASVFLKRCNGNESSLQECGIDSFSRCGQYATVVCNRYAPDIMVNITVLEKSIKLKYKMERKMVCAWEEGCMAEDGLAKAMHEVNTSHVVRKLLAFSSHVQNFGNADFRPPGTRKLWHYHQCHKHYHSITDFALYELRSKENGNVVQAGHKVSFCLRDNSCVDMKRKNYNCRADIFDGDQGISIGCADHYTNKLDCQWIDVTGVPSGKYTLEIHSNPYLLVPEQDYSNNFVICDVHLRDQDVTGSNCRYPADFDIYNE